SPRVRKGTKEKARRATRSRSPRSSPPTARRGDRGGGRGEGRHDEGRARRGGLGEDWAAEEAGGDRRQHRLREHRRDAEDRREDRAARLRQLPHPPARLADGAQPEDRREGRRARQADPVLQARQGAARAAQPGVGVPAGSRRMEVLFTPWRYAYVEGHRDDREGATGCFLCDAAATPDDPERLVVHAAAHHIVVLNRHPYSNGHLMVVPREHVALPQDASPAARAEAWPVLLLCQRLLAAAYRPDGLNVGLN